MATGLGLKRQGSSSVSATEGLNPDPDAFHASERSEFEDLTEKSTPVDADLAVIEDSGDSFSKKKLSWSNIKATLQAAFDSVYASIAPVIGEWDASTGSFPDSPEVGDRYRVEVPGTVGGVEYFWGDIIIHNGGTATASAGWTLIRSKNSLRVPKASWLDRKPGSIIFYFDYPDFFGTDTASFSENWEDPEWSFRRLVVEIKNQPHVHWIVVVNPNSGPGASVDDQWTQAIEWLKGAGATVVAYVSTDFGGPFDPDNTGHTSLATTQDYIDQLDTWVEFYPEIDGFWFDEIPFYTQDSQSPPNLEANDAREFYKDLTQYAKLNLNRLWVGGNPGQEQFDDLYFQLNLFDVLMIYEQETEPSGTDVLGNYGWRDNMIRVYPTRKAILPHNLDSGTYLDLDDIADRVHNHSRYVDYITYWHDDEYGNGLAWDSDAYEHHVRAIGEGWRKAYLDSPRVYTKQQGFGIATLTDGANISWDLDEAQTAEVTLEGNRTLDNPTNMKNGFRYCLYVRQDGTGNRTLSYGSDYDFGDDGSPTLTTTANEGDLLEFVAVNDSMVYTGIKKGFGA